LKLVDTEVFNYEKQSPNCQLKLHQINQISASSRSTSNLSYSTQLPGEVRCSKLDISKACERERSEKWHFFIQTIISTAQMKIVNGINLNACKERGRKRKR
jgi:hypothetical protein